MPPPPRRARRLLGVTAAAFLILASAGGCVSWPQGGNLFGKNKAQGPVPVDSFVLRGDTLEKDARGLDNPVAIELTGAKRLYEEGKFDQARPIFAGIAGNTKNPIVLAEEACYYEADCLRMEGYYPSAGDVYIKLLNTFPSSRFGKHARHHMFEIANYWLDATREEMKAVKEQEEGKRWQVLPVLPASFAINIDKTKPVTDMEGHALRLLENIHITDAGGPLGDKALFLMAGVHWFRQDYAAADHHFSELVKSYPNSEHAPEALQLSVVCKQMSTGGSEYDPRKLAEARELIEKAVTYFPKMATEKRDFLEKQLASISAQQADKDMKFAEFYERTGHPASAYFYYEIVRRRYPGSQFAQQATERMARLKTELDRSPPQQQPAAGRGNPGADLRAAPPSLVPGTPLQPLTPQSLPMGMGGGRP
jgi:outer membrane protein assembly factor BamD (BamD/ComL family)